MTISSQPAEPAAVLVTRLETEVFPQLADLCGWPEPFDRADIVTRKSRGTVFRCVHRRGTLAVKLEGIAARASQSARDEYDAMAELHRIDPSQTRLAVARPVAHVRDPAAVASEWVEAPTLSEMLKAGWTAQTEQAVRRVLDWIAAHQTLPHGHSAIASDPAASCKEAAASALEALPQPHLRQTIEAACARYEALFEESRAARTPRVRRHGDGSAGNFLVTPQRVIAVDLSRELVGSPYMDAIQLAIDVHLHLPGGAAPLEERSGLPDPLVRLMEEAGFFPGSGAARAAFLREFIALALTRVAELAHARNGTPYGPSEAAMARMLELTGTIAA